MDPGDQKRQLATQASVTERLGLSWFGFLSFQRLVLVQKESFNHRNMKKERVRKGMFSSGSVSLLRRNFAVAILRVGTVSATLLRRKQGVLNRS